ncbi:urease accessory protein [Friedmanniella luteola]|uniref:Urease accessory protein n=1 Tax=Friedmanniella luteola TaxID=546871 RepID=A0A1H1P230_9ACTN|nr:urease accessory UreF family protein [Friedmanniella luteola]SDS05065.1 urease accessory protein [Friedmanniella luteola]
MTAPYLSLLLADGRLPTGAHTQSAGVEPAFQAGMAVSAVPDYLTVRLRTVTEVEAATAVLARRTWLDGAPDRLAGLVTLDAAWRARTVSDVLRDAADLLGRSYLRLAAAVWDLAALVGAGRVWCRAVVVGVTAAEAGLSAAETARLVAFEDVQTVLAAALKLAPFDPALGVAWAVRAQPEVEGLVARVADLTRAADLPAPTAPLLEQWGQQHRDSERRLFRA